MEERALISPISLFSQGEGGAQGTVLGQGRRACAKVKAQSAGHFETPIFEEQRCEKSEKSEKSPALEPLPGAFLAFLAG
jgi:hypothetical protein